MLPFMTYEVLRHIEVTIITRGEAPPLFLEPSHLQMSHNQHFVIVIIFPIVMQLVHDDALTPENLPQLSLQLKVVSLEKVPGDQPTQVLN